MITFLSTRVTNFVMKIFNLKHIKWSFLENC